MRRHAAHLAEHPDVRAVDLIYQPDERYGSIWVEAPHASPSLDAALARAGRTIALAERWNWLELEFATPDEVADDGTSWRSLRWTFP